MPFFIKNYFNKLSQLPFLLLFIVSLICCLGFLVLWSAAGGNLEPWAFRQIINFCLFLPISIFIALIDLKIIFKFSYFFYIVILLLLVWVEFFGITAMGGKRWINLGFTRIQPSEPAKLAIVLMLARYFHQLKAKDLTHFFTLIAPVLAILLPTLLIIKQPDLGTGMITLIVAATIFLAIGVEIWKFLVAGGTFICSLPIIWHMMYDYQRKRVLVFLDPKRDPLGDGYNIIQSKIAIGSGGLFGKGLTHGTQSHLDFLPEHQTDFIFATFAEEFGFIGCMVLLILYLLLIFVSLSITINCRSVFGKLLGTGIVAIIFSHIFINMGMVMGILPAVGVPLPFISYGGTMMVSMLIGIGLIMNIQIHQHRNI